MPFINWLCAALLLLPLLAAQPALPPSLAATLRAARWQHRVLLIGAPVASEFNFQQQKKLLAAATAGLQTRDFQIIELPYGQLSLADRATWTRQLHQPLDKFSVVLIGKDGGVKQASARPLPPADLFATVDKMPMRRQELRRGQ